MKKSKKFIKKKNKILIVGLISVVVLSGVAIIFTVFNNPNSNSIKTSNENLLTSEDGKSNQIECVSRQQTENNNKNQTSTNEKDKNAENQNQVDKMPSVDTSKNGHDFSKWNNTCEPKLVVVNKDNPIPADYKSNIIDYNNIKINSIAKDSLDNMINAASQKGLKIYPSSGYRTVTRQTTLFNNQVSKCKKQGYKSSNAEVMAATVVAKPGTSEHHTGLAIDFNGVKDDFYKTKEYAWLMENAPEYGFILRYPKDKIDITHVIYEPWHFRYVGTELAKKISQSGLCLEEYMALWEKGQ